eukprot:gnl/TRDRNA2_/TRDRNA2_186234_c0_seq1.p1 gnl/TRDRNA2_/TRDRNA2_186234_c0~~gnl/TRDRNA2_/TRDRNA2_186234_c0_seq1.p1  ORF type:complete len:319 (+),score=88.78 gnl/TRDRNA2_/TRDRNA2_186234_c0_seq1:106-1062(+)
MHTPMQGPKGELLPGSAAELRALANEAMGRGEDKRAAHLYTLAIDLLARGMKRDKDGRAAAEDLFRLNKSCDGELAKLLSNRSLAHLKQGDAAGAVEDADACTKAEPTFDKGHMRLVAALESEGATLLRQLEACDVGLAVCPNSELLRSRRERLAKAVATQRAAGSGAEEHNAGHAEESAQLSAIEQTRRLADMPSDPRRAMAAADLGSALAVGAFGLKKNLQEAERYLRIGSEGGDVTAQRNLGMLLLEMDRGAEAAEELSGAADAGDEQAAEALQQLLVESRVQEMEARMKLEQMAAAGDPRAIEMLREFPAPLVS